jgi:hypothetical protein
MTLALACAACGCATTPSSRPGVMSPLPGGSPPSASAKPGDEIPVPKPVSVPVGTTSSGGSIRASAPRSVSVVDSLPSADALSVLATIPEPLPPGQRVPPPATSAGQGISAPAPEAAYDTLRTRAPEEENGDVPIPSPTQALGERPANRPAPVDSLASPASPPATAPPAAAPPATPPPASPPPASAPAAPDTCWRVQFAAPEERERADALRAAAESQLSLPAVVEAEARRFKVRTRDCMTEAEADRLKTRAAQAGFDGAFRFVWKKP